TFSTHFYDGLLERRAVHSSKIQTNFLRAMQRCQSLPCPAVKATRFVVGRVNAVPAPKFMKKAKIKNNTKKRVVFLFYKGGEIANLSCNGSFIINFYTVTTIIIKNSIVK